VDTRADLSVRVRLAAEQSRWLNWGLAFGGDAPVTTTQGLLLTRQPGQPLGHLVTLGPGADTERVHKAVLLALCVLALSGCEEIFVGEPETPRCSGGSASPLSAEVVLQTLREEGLTMDSDEESELCAIADVVADFTNAGENASQEGFVGCTVRREPLRGNTLRVDLDAPPASPIFSGDKAKLWLANVECTIYPEGDNKAGQVARVQRALEKLETRL
jgi:hypothetical protein